MALGSEPEESKGRSEPEECAGRTLLKPFLASALAMLLAWPPFRSSSRILVPLLTFFRAAMDSTVTCTAAGFWCLC